jgi:hypothetical protein
MSVLKESLVNNNNSSSSYVPPSNDNTNDNKINVDLASLVIFFRNNGLSEKTSTVSNIIQQ